jgi:parallel beta-helix repeat protein
MRTKNNLKPQFRPHLEWLESRELLSTYVVSTSGSDSNNGITAPWATLQHAANVVQAGDTVQIRAGNYAGFDMFTSGTSGSMIRFLADPGVNITSPEHMRGKDGINLEGASFIDIEGFNASNLAEAGIRSVTNNGCVIAHNVTDHNGVWGIFTGFSDNVLIEYNTCSNSVQQHGIYVSNSCVNPTVRGNTIFGNAGCGIHMNGDISQGGTGIITGALVEDNVIYNNGTAGGSGINCDGVQNSIFRNNLIYNEHASGISLYQGDASQPANNDVVVNNTVILASDGRWCLNIQSGSTGEVIFNNIFLNNNPSHGAIDMEGVFPIYSDYNTVQGGNNGFTDGVSNYNLAGWQSKYGQDTHSLTATAAQLFVNPAGNDYHLLSTSPAIDKGVASFHGQPAPATDLDGKPRPSGSAYDIGAYEFQTVATNQPPTVATPASALPSTVTGKTTNLSVLGADDGGETNLTYTWSSSGPAAVAFSANGTNAAKNTTATFTQAGSYSFTVTIKDAGGLTATSSVNVTVNQTLTSVSVSPSSATVANGATKQFTATAKDQFGKAMSASIAWSVSTSSGSPGTISTSGLYTAPSSGSPTVTVKAVATSGSISVSSTASVTVGKKKGPFINVGGGAVGSFAADGFFSGGSTNSVTHAIDTSGVTNPAPQSVYQTWRYGNFTYTIPNLTPGATYTVRLDFSENIATAPGQRVFNVAINGTQVLTNFDIFVAAGGQYKAIARTFTAVADSTGTITIQFTGVVGPARVSGIEIT